MTNLWCQGLNIQETKKSQGYASCSSTSSFMFPRAGSVSLSEVCGHFKDHIKTTGYDRLFPWFLQVLVHGLCAVVPLYCPWITCTCLHTLMPVKNRYLLFSMVKAGGKASWGLELLPCSSWVKAESDPWEGQQGSILLLFLPHQDFKHNSHMAHAEQGAESCALTSGSFTRWLMPRMARGEKEVTNANPNSNMSTHLMRLTRKNSGSRLSGLERLSWFLWIILCLSP